MGNRVIDIHTPTTTGADAPPNGDHATSIEALSTRKEAIEAEISALWSVLSSHGVNMNTSLTTFDGYPRDDIDIAQIRTTRAKIIRLRNDHKTILARVEKALQDHFALHSQETATPATGQGAPSPSDNDRPFAKVQSVDTSSPAAEAGLKPGDIVTRFGDAGWLNHEKLSRVAQIVSQYEGRVVTVKIIRLSEATGNNQTHELSLTPNRTWGGKGLLGCRLIPL